jgi:hypothetical protein
MLGIDLDAHKVPDRKKLGYVLRAAALVELGLRGNLADSDGKVQVTREARTGDAVLDTVQGEIAADRARKWKYWVRHNAGGTLSAVESQLVGAGAIKVQRRTLLADKVEAADPAAVGELRQRVRTTLTGGRHIEELDPYDVALTALAANGALSTAIPNRERRAHKDRVKALTDHIGTSAPALKQLVAELRLLRSVSTGWIGAAQASASAS